MSEQQGKVIDGTARASQWRRSSPSPETDVDGAQGHSEAPKHIASSLLVPAQMLLDGTPSAASTATSDKPVREDPGEPPSGLAPHPPVTGGDSHVNIFLAAHATSDVATGVKEPFLHRLGRLRGRQDGRRWRSIAVRTRTAVRPITIAVSTLGVLAALAVVSSALWHSGVPARQSNSVRRAESLDSMKPDVLTASADPFATKPAAHRSGVGRPHYAKAEHPKKHSAATRRSTSPGTTGNQRMVMAHYTTTSSTPSRAGATSDTPRSSGTGSTPTTSTPAIPTHYTSSSNSGPRSGSSSRSGNPSQAALRSLVTGAGQCGCQ